MGAPRSAWSLTETPPDAHLRARLRSFYREDTAYASQQASHDLAYFDRFSRVVTAAVDVPAPRILEVGSGVATALRALVDGRSGSSAVALELSAEALRRLKHQSAGRVTGVAGDALDLPFAEGSFDAVACFEVLEHLPDVGRAVDEALRVLKRPGYLIAGIPNHGSLWTPLADAIRGRTRRAFGVDGRRGALRWLRRNLGVALRKRLRGHRRFLYREPCLDAVRGGDADAVYYACPIDLVRFLRLRGGTLVTDSARLRLGPLGWCLPYEFQGSAVLAWRVD
ncbi:MAG: class I SAM-dependent methyltransferase [Gemmatimonadetes bacterium]|nr:class I SAM-dependent methyltransferase [Gemmatimonadota bacterium]